MDSNTTESYHLAIAFVSGIAAVLGLMLLTPIDLKLSKDSLELEREIFRRDTTQTNDELGITISGDFVSASESTVTLTAYPESHEVRFVKLMFPSYEKTLSGPLAKSFRHVRSG